MHKRCVHRLSTYDSDGDSSDNIHYCNIFTIGARVYLLPICCGKRCSKRDIDPMSLQT